MTQRSSSTATIIPKPTSRRTKRTNLGGGIRKCKSSSRIALTQRQSLASSSIVTGLSIPVLSGCDPEARCLRISMSGGFEIGHPLLECRFHIEIRSVRLKLGLQNWRRGSPTMRQRCYALSASSPACGVSASQPASISIHNGHRPQGNY